MATVRSPRRRACGASPLTAQSLERRSSDAAYAQEINQRLRDGSSEAEARCGVVQIADRSVAATFVGLVAACLTVAELVRALHGGPGDGVPPTHKIIAANLANPSRIDAVPNRETGAPSNPGWAAT